MRKLFCDFEKRRDCEDSIESSVFAKHRTKQSNEIVHMEEMI